MYATPMCRAMCTAYPTPMSRALCTAYPTPMCSAMCTVYPTQMCIPPPAIKSVTYTHQTINTVIFPSPVNLG